MSAAPRTPAPPPSAPVARRRRRAGPCPSCSPRRRGCGWPTGSRCAACRSSMRWCSTAPSTTAGGGRSRRETGWGASRSSRRRSIPICSPWSTGVWLRRTRSTCCRSPARWPASTACTGPAARWRARRAGAPPARALAALYGPSVFHDVQLLKESLAVSLVAAAALGARGGAAPRPRGAGSRPALSARLLALLRENVLLVAPFLALLVWARGRPRRSRLARDLVCSPAGWRCRLLPVAARNAALGGGFLPTTYQGGVNFYIGNNAAADGTYRPLVPGPADPGVRAREPWRLAEAARGRTLTAAEVSRFWFAGAGVGAPEHPPVSPSAAAQARALLERLRVAGRGRLLLDGSARRRSRRRCSSSGGSSSGARGVLGPAAARGAAGPAGAGLRSRRGWMRRRWRSSSSRATACRRCRRCSRSPRFPWRARRRVQ